MSAWLLKLEAADERLLEAVLVRRRTRLDQVMTGITHLGDWWVVTLVVTALALGTVPALAEAGVQGAWTVIVSHVLVQLLKRSVGRPRPDLAPGIGLLADPPDRFSFPSGHGTAALSVSLVFATPLPGLAGAPIVCLGLLVGVSRCYLGVHYPGDVAMGWLLALTTWWSWPGVQLLLGG